MRTLAVMLGACLAFAIQQPLNAQQKDVLNINIAKNAPYTIELNKIMQKDGKCLLFLISDTQTKETYPEFSVEFVMFDENGKIIDDVNSLIVPLKPDREIVSRFALDGIDCSAISRVHINEVFASQEDNAASFYDKTAIRSRLDVKVTR